MNQRERGFLLLASDLGDPNRKPLTTAQLRILADRTWQMEQPREDRDLQPEDLMALGYGTAMAQRIVYLLSQEDVLDRYLARGKQKNCIPITRVSPGYPILLRRRLGCDSPGTLWARGDAKLLQTPMIALVGSRDLMPENQKFAEEVGRQAALQGFTLVSGNARGADKTAQEACLEAGGRVVCVVADELHHHARENVLYLSEENFDAPFSSQRALSRNRVIHALGAKTLVAQCSLGMGGSWDGSVKNLRFGWSKVFCFDDGSRAMAQLAQMGATLVTCQVLSDLNALQSPFDNLFDQ